MLGMVLSLSLLPAALIAQTSDNDLPSAFLAFGFGAGPEYQGADDVVWAIAPIGFGEIGTVGFTLAGNYLSVDLLDDPKWAFGPAGILRLGRSDVSDQQVAGLPDINMTVDLGFNLARKWNDRDYQRRATVGFSVLHDVGGVHDGWVLTASASKWFPVGQYGALLVGVGTVHGSDDYAQTYFGVDAKGSAASGLPMFQASGGARDVSAFAGIAQPISRNWAVGGGLMYSRLLGDAADSPVTKSRDQLYAGIGVGYLF